MTGILVAVIFALGAIFGAGIASLYVKVKTNRYPWDLK